MRDIVVHSQIVDLAQARSADVAPLRAAQSEHATIVRDLARLKTEEVTLRKMDVSAEAARQRDTIYRDELARSRDRVAKREDELKLEMQEKLSNAAIHQRESDIQPSSPAFLPQPDPHATPLPLHSDADVVSLTSTSARTAAERQSVLWQVQRASLIAEIRADTLNAVQQVAQRRGWILDTVGAPGSPDGTAEAADELRAQWRIGK